jgi:hypothetical protein
MLRRLSEAVNQKPLMLLHRVPGLFQTVGSPNAMPLQKLLALLR